MHSRILATTEELNGRLSLNSYSSTSSSFTKMSSSLAPLASSSTLWCRGFCQAVIVVVIILAATAHIAPNDLHFGGFLASARWSATSSRHLKTVSNCWWNRPLNGTEWLVGIAADSTFKFLDCFCRQMSCPLLG